jgi:thiol:disulfide interchange protein DsbD
MGMRVMAVFLVVLVSVAAACGGRPDAAASTGALPYVASLAEARAQAAREGKLVMVNFYASWCGWCRKLESKTLADPQVVKALAPLVPVRLDGDREGRDEAARLKVRGYPTIVFLAADGREVGRIPGYLEPGPFLQELADILK